MRTIPARLALPAMALAAALALVPGAARAQDATWLLNPTIAGPTLGTFDFNANANWNPATVPTGTAFFGFTNQPNISFSANATIGGWTFTLADGGSNYNFTNDVLLVFNGAGIVINGGSATITNNNTLNFNNSSTAGSATITNDTTLDFNATSTAGSATITNNLVLNFNATSTAGSATITNNLSLIFFDTSNAGSATITNNSTLHFIATSNAGSATITNDEFLEFFNTSTAGSATITNNNTVGALVRFLGTSTAGSATITNNRGLLFMESSTAGSATITNNLLLQFDDTSTAGSAAITNNAFLNFGSSSTASTATIINNSFLEFFDISTAGSATITNNNLLQFNDTSTAGSATITNNNNNALRFFNSSTAGSATITTNNGGTTQFFNNSTGGQARFINNAGGVVDFSGSTGPAGTGQLTAGSLAGAGNYLFGDNELTVGGNNLSSTVSGVISGTGAATGTSLIKTGTGTFTLAGVNIYTGATIVDAGALIVNGSIVSPTTVNGGATLGGTGMLGPVTVNGGGVYAPGNSIGTQTVNGNFTLGKGAIFEVEVNAAGQGDKVIVNGTVNLTGSVLRVLAANGNYKPKTNYLIIANDGTDAVKGKFAKVTDNLAFLTPSVNYKGGTGNDVVLTLINTTSDFCSVARTRNQCNVAMALDRFPTDNPLFLAVLNQTPEGARTAFDALSGEIHATVTGTLADDSRYVREAILARLMQANYTGSNNVQVAALAAAGPQMVSLDTQAMTLGYDDKSLSAPASAPLALWTRAYGAWGNFDGDGNAATADRDLGGFVSGIDASMGRSWRIGLATGASFSNIDVDARYSSADVDSFDLAGYLGGMAGGFALRGGGAWAWSDIDTSRAVIFPGFFERQKASYDADTGQLFGEIAYPTQMGNMAVEPFAGLAFVSIDTDGFKEHGGSLASLRGSSDEDVGYSTLGVRAAQVTHWGEMQVVPHVSAAWQHAFSDVTPDAALTFASTGIGFTVYGVPLAKDSALIDAGLDFALGERTTAGVSYSGQFGDSVTDNAVKGRLTWLF